LRRYKVGGLKAVFNKLTHKKIIDRINTPSGKKKILYITITPSFNLLRQSICIRKSGNYETILLMESPWLLRFMERYFDAVCIYDTYYALANILKEVKPYMIHVQGSMLGSDFLCMLAKLLNNSKIVFEFYDVPSLTITKEDSVCTWGEKDTKLGFFAEQYACENLDGIVLGYSHEAAEILRKHYNTTVPVLEFHSYPCKEFFAEKSNGFKKRLVYGGLVYPKNCEEIFSSYQLYELIEVLTKQGFYFDVYASPHISNISFEKHFIDYIKFSTWNEYFKFHKGILPTQAPKIFSQYDFGMVVYLFKGDLNNPINSHNKIRLTNKIFFYIEAGLPIIVSEEFKYVSKLVREYEIGIVVSQKDIPNLSKIISTYNYEKLKNNVRVARKELSMENNINRLIGFYEEIKLRKEI